MEINHSVLKIHTENGKHSQWKWFSRPICIGHSMFVWGINEAESTPLQHTLVEPVKPLLTLDDAGPSFILSCGWMGGAQG